MTKFEPSPVTVDNVRRATQRDPVTSQVHKMVIKGWLSRHVPEIDPYYARRDEITGHSGCFMWRIRVIVPPKFRPQELVQLPQKNLGVVKMKALARSFIPGGQGSTRKLNKSPALGAS